MDVLFVVVLDVFGFVFDFIFGFYYDVRCCIKFCLNIVDFLKC